MESLLVSILSLIQSNRLVEVSELVWRTRVSGHFFFMWAGRCLHGLLICSSPAFNSGMDHPDLGLTQYARRSEVFPEILSSSPSLNTSEQAKENITLRSWVSVCMTSRPLNHCANLMTSYVWRLVTLESSFLLFCKVDPGHFLKEPSMAPESKKVKGLFLQCSFFSLSPWLAFERLFISLDGNWRTRRQWSLPKSPTISSFSKAKGPTESTFKAWTNKMEWAASTMVASKYC